MPATALAVSVMSLLRLGVTPERWLNESICDAAAGIAKFTPDPVPCLAIAGVTLTYWCVKERDDAVASLGAMAGWLMGIPGIDRVIPLGIGGLNLMFATIKRMMYEQIRAEGRAESRREVNAEWQAWYDRRTATGVFVADDDDPPPHQRKEQQ